MSQEIHLYDFVPHPYREVRALLAGEPEALLPGAGEAATARSEEVSALLGVALDGMEIQREVTVEIGELTERPNPRPSTVVPLHWRASRLPAAFPSMEAELRAEPLSATETRISLVGTYRPPLGPIGAAVDRLALHRVAQASLHRFLEELIETLRARLADR